MRNQHTHRALAMPEAPESRCCKGALKEDRAGSGCWAAEGRWERRDAMQWRDQIENAKEENRNAACCCCCCCWWWGRSCCCREKLLMLAAPYSASADAGVVGAAPETAAAEPAAAAAAAAPASPAAAGGSARLCRFDCREPVARAPAPAAMPCPPPATPLRNT
jgi:hypothetical protein